MDYCRLVSEIRHTRSTITAFLDRQSLRTLLSAVSVLERPDCRNATPSVLLSLILSEWEDAGKSWVRAQGLPSQSTRVDDVTLPRALFRGARVPWSAVFDESESWAAIRGVAVAEGLVLAPEASLVAYIFQLCDAEDSVGSTFPVCSLFHSHLMRLANDDLLTWRRKIVRWLRALSSKLRLTATIVTQGVALADYYLARCWGPGGVSPEELQLVYLSALCLVASSAGGVGPGTLDSLREATPQYTEVDRTETEGRLRRACASTAPPALDPASMAQPPLGVGSDAEDWAVVAGRMPSLAPHFLQQPQQQPQQLQPELPLLAAIQAAHPISFAGPLISCLPAAWTAAILPSVLESLFAASIEVELHCFSPQTIAVAAVHAALAAAGLAHHVTASLWLVLAWRSLHVDVASVRRCVRLLRALSGPQAARGAAAAVADEVIPASVADAAVMDAMVAVVQHTSLAARSVTLRLKQRVKGGLAASGDHPHPAPVTAGGEAARLLARLHPRTFIEAVALEAEMRGADPEAIEELLAEAADVEALAAAVLGPSATCAASTSDARQDSALLSLDTGETTPEVAVGNSGSRVPGVAQQGPQPLALPVIPVSGALPQSATGTLAAGGVASAFPRLRGGMLVDAVPRGGLAAAVTSGDVRLELLLPPQITVPPPSATLDSWTDPRAPAVDFGHWRASGNAAESTPSLRRGAFDASPSKMMQRDASLLSNGISPYAESATPNVRRRSSAGAAESIDAACSPVARHRPPLVSPDAAARLGAGDPGAASPAVSVRVVGSRSRAASSQARMCAAVSASKAQVPPLALPSSPGATLPSRRSDEGEGHSCCCIQ